MNYRHAYHAGNFADVLKHAVLTLLLAHLKRKDTPFAVVDSHAGIGRYDLAAEAPSRTLEYQEGIARLLAVPPMPALAAYLAAVRAVNGGGGLRFYPGSPRIARHLLRPGDRLVLVELHPEDVAALRREFAGDPQVAIHHRDAYEALKALLPPPERRGLVLIDPPFEVRDEFQRILRGLRQAFRRWPTGIYAVWYPIKARPPVSDFLTGVKDMAPKSAFAAELLIRPESDPERLNGCGMVVINPPWRLAEAVEELLPRLAEVLGRERPSWRLEWLAAE